MFCKVSSCAGLCFGLFRAVEKVFSEGPENLCFLGNLAHNQILMQKLKDAGAVVVDDIASVPKGSKVVIRAHGEKRDVIENIKFLGFDIIDLTCPKVKFIHKIVSEAESLGKTIIVIGDSKHPEVAGIVGWCHRSFVVGDIEDAFKKLRIFKLLSGGFCVVSQTTFGRKHFESIFDFLKKNLKEVEVKDTTCQDSEIRRTELEKESQVYDLIVVVGNSLSSNSSKLFETARGICKNSIHVERPSELPVGLKRYESVFITGSASTMKETVEEVKESILNLWNL
ncbi:MAG: 4-hydroxy-3-methylbut-2-enyl diphosphate reductase [Oscillospiraceae bacterium]|jgi:4-hydroxy-3-methylbut-2-enyl diphosphate reductase|nr:4-hydroxy-3-methylbut-2-enyl diphosphate reductase [Oscillospiraceae bacterium]